MWVSMVNVIVDMCSQPRNVWSLPVPAGTQLKSQGTCSREALPGPTFCMSAGSDAIVEDY